MSHNALESLYFRFGDLPTNLVLRIALWAQLLWREALFSPQAPYVGARRYAPRRLAPAVEDEPSCCSGQDWYGSRPCCLKRTKEIPLALRSPAHCLSQVGRSLRAVLAEENKETDTIWSLDNTLFPLIAQHTEISRGRTGGRTVIHYRAKSLAALNVCACVIPGSAAFYTHLESIKLAIPWLEAEAIASDSAAYDLTQSLVYGHLAAEASRLSYFDLEIYDRAPHAMKYRECRVMAVLCKSLEVSRLSNSPAIYYSPRLVSLHVHFSFAWKANFASEFSSALQACAGTLLYLTIDAGRSVFGELEHIALSSLRFLRLVSPQSKAGRFLRNVDLPHELDMHLELVVEWRRHIRDAPVEHMRYDAPIWRSEMIEDQEQDGGILRDYAKALAAPTSARRLFSTSSSAFSRNLNPKPDYRLWMSLCYIGLDIRIDSDSVLCKHIAGRLPEYVAVCLARSASEVDAVLNDSVARDWRNSGVQDGGRAARRSLLVRDGQFAAFLREGTHSNKFPKALYDAATYVIRAIFADRVNDPSVAQEVVFARNSWLPDRSLAFSEILDQFWGLRSIRFTSPPLARDIPFTRRQVGHLAVDHLNALALYLNTPREANLYPCMVLEKISFSVASSQLANLLPAKSELLHLFNGERCGDFSVPRIEVAILITGGSD
ncbi:unnamed protein product [Peniophora sp. CBMAI 1063]|nr:unnamed protein product [Peniophora sp. CBMAI 1063]